MKCKKIYKKMNSYFGEKLTKLEYQKFELHLKNCASCHNIISEVEHTLNLPNETKQLVADSFMFTRIQQQIINHTRQGTNLWQRVLQPIAAMVIIAIGLTVGIGLGSKYYNDSTNQGFELSDVESQLSNDELYLNAIAYESIETFLLTE
jgi:hypothetical protein